MIRERDFFCLFIIGRIGLACGKSNSALLRFCDKLWRRKFRDEFKVEHITRRAADYRLSGVIVDWRVLLTRVIVAQMFWNCHRIVTFVCEKEVMKCKLMTIVGASVLAGVIAGCKPSPQSETDAGGAGGGGGKVALINGAGATFPYPLYSKWFDAYTKVDPTVRFNYQSIGSGGGIKQILERTVDFGATDAPMEDENLAKAPGKILHIPTVAGAVVVAYKLEGNLPLKLSGDTISKIFLGQIKKWNDPAIARENPGVQLPDTDIVVVHRSDGSGTTHIFTDYLSSVSPEWKEKIGTGKSVAWPMGLGAKGNEGVAGQLRQLEGSIGYVELAYAVQNKLPYADIINSSGNAVKPSIESVTQALAETNVPDDFRFSMVNPPGANAYPIAGATWLLVYQQQPDPVEGKKLVEFLRWSLTEGEQMASDLHYAPLPENLQSRVLEAVGTIQY